MSRVYYCETDDQWNNLIGALHSVGFASYKNRKYVNDEVLVALRDAKHIEVTEYGYQLLPAKLMRHRPCIRMTDDLVDVMHICSHDKEVLREWLLNQ